MVYQLNGVWYDLKVVWSWKVCAQKALFPVLLNLDVDEKWLDTGLRRD